MKIALLYYHAPAENGPSEGKVADWVGLDTDGKDAGAYVYEADFTRRRQRRR